MKNITNLIKLFTMPIRNINLFFDFIIVFFVTFNNIIQRKNWGNKN